MMKTFIIFFLFVSLMFGQPSTTINDVTMSSSFNDFDAVYASVDISIGYASSYALAKYIVQYWDGDSWEHADEVHFWTPDTPIWNGEFTEDIYIEGIASEGNGNFRVKFYSYADAATDEDGYHNFSVTDVTAPSAPTNLSISNSGGNPLLQWSANSEIDLKRYRVYRVNSDPSSWYVTGT